MDERNFNYWHKEYLIKTIFQPDSGVEWTRICAWTMTQNWVCKMKFKNRPLEKKVGTIRQVMYTIWIQLELLTEKS